MLNQQIVLNKDTAIRPYWAADSLFFLLAAHQQTTKLLTGKKAEKD
jgi:hypothetical protein